jgi:flavodoxin
MKTLIVCYSYYHYNTDRIALVFAKILGAEIKTPQEVNQKTLSDYGLIGFGSGIYDGKHHKSILDFVDDLPHVVNVKAFIFSTSGQIGSIASTYHQSLREKVRSKGFHVVGEFNCAGFDSYDVLNVDGHLNKGRPNEDDLKQAEAFAYGLKKSANDHE